MANWLKTVEVLKLVPPRFDFYNGKHGLGMVEEQTNKSGTVILERRFVPKGSLIMRQGEEGTNAFLIQSGTVKVFIDSEGRHTELSQLGTGQIFGEMALVFDQPRTASVEAIEDCNLIVITRETFNQKMEKSDPTVKAVLPMLMKRIIESNNALLSKNSSLDGLGDMIKSVYDNVYATVPRSQQKTLESSLLPSLESFLNALKKYQENFGE